MEKEENKKEIKETKEEIIKKEENQERASKQENSNKEESKEKNVAKAEANIVEEGKEEQAETRKQKKEETKQAEVKQQEKEETEQEENKQAETRKQEKEEKTSNTETEYKIKEPKKRKKGLMVAIIVTTIICISMLFSIIFSLINMNNQTIMKGISVLGIDVANLTPEEANKKINDAIENRFQDENNNLILKRNNTEISVTANTFNAKFDVEKAVIEAYNIGRSGNIVTNNYAILFAQILKKEIKPELHLDNELLETTITDANAKMEDRVIESSYYVEDKKLNIVKGKAGYTINKEKLKQEIYKQLNNIHTNYQVIEIPVEHKEPEDINLEKIRNEIYREPKDAYVEKNPTKVHTHIDGVDFAISMEEAKKIIQEDKEEYTIPLKITTPKKTINDLGEEAFPELLATFSTIYDASNRNRSNNIELASKKVNGTVVMPGEKFSYNTVVGKRTIEAGFKEGTAYIGGKVVPDVGGGVCQLSSTLYNTALLANLDILERSSHMFLTGYVAASRDATVYYGSLDFVFKNSRNYPIKIVATSQNGVCKVSIYGIKEETEYEVIIQSKVTSYINYTTTYKNDGTLAEGREVIEQHGANGCRSEGYKILKLNGKIVSQTLLSKDTYSAKEKIVKRGTKKVATPPVQTPPEQTSPEQNTQDPKPVENTVTQ